MANSRSRQTDTLFKIQRTPLLTAEKERELARRIIRDNDAAAREQLVLANLRFVIRIARSYVNRGVEMQDLIAEGNIGLLKAVDGFNPEFNMRFATYAGWWIRQSIRRALIKTSAPFHVPAYMMDMMGKFRRVRAQLHNELGREPSAAEIAFRLDIAEQAARSLQELDQRSKRTVRSGDPEDGVVLDTFLKDEKTTTPDNSASQNEDIELMLAFLNKINKRSARILKVRFGLAGADAKSLCEIGATIGLTRERVRQIEQRALRDLFRQMTRSWKFPPQESLEAAPRALSA